jgi:DNA-binding MarR family transcriptional regulator
MDQAGQSKPVRPDDGSLGRDTAEEMLAVLQSFERVVRWGFRTHQHPEDPGPAAQATLFFLQRHQPARAKDIADWLGIGAAPMSRQLADLEAQQLVTRTPDPDDARAALTSLTAVGVHAVQDLRNRRVTVLQRALAGLDEAEARGFITSLERVLEQFRHGLESMGKEGRP